MSRINDAAIDAMNADEFELSETEADEFWRWLAESGQLAVLNAMLASLPEELPHPRNAPCTCGSGKKYKKCCGG